MHNADLCDTLGNLVHRATNLCKKYCGGLVPDVPAPENPPIDMVAVAEAFTAKMKKFELEGGAGIAMQGFRDVNGFLTTEAPWLKKGDEHAEVRQITVRATLEAIYALAHLLTPFVPIGCSAIFKKLGTEPVTLTELGKDCRNLKVGTTISVGDVLYSKLLSDAEKSNAAEASKNKKEAYEEAQRKKKEKKARESAASKAGQAAGPDQPEFTKLEIRVGKIVKVRFNIVTREIETVSSTYISTTLLLFRCGTMKRPTNYSVKRLMSAKRVDPDRSHQAFAGTTHWKKCKTRRFWLFAI